MTTRRSLDRKPLADLIPLDSPYTAFIEPTNRCNFRCVFCPTGTPDLLRRVGRKMGDMPLDFAKQIIDQFKQFPHRLRMLNFQYMGEPLLNPHTYEMIAYAVDRDVSEWYEIRTNGYLLNPLLNRRLVRAGVNRVGISVEALDEAGYLALSGVKNFNMRRFMDNIADLHENRGDRCEVYIKIADTGLTEEQKGRFFEMFGPLADDIQIEYLIDWNNSPGYDFKLGVKSGKMMKGHLPYPKNVCSYPFYTLGLTWQGEAIMCCVDWSYQTSVGNAHDNTLQEIWSGERIKQFRLMHLEGRRGEHPACGTCTGLYMCPDVLDDRAQEITERIKNV